MCVNTLLTQAIVDEATIEGVVAESHGGREAVFAKAYVDSIGVGGVSVEKYHEFMETHGAEAHYGEGWRSGEEGKIVRLQAHADKLPVAFREGTKAIGMMSVITTVHDDYFMFLKLNYQMPVNPTDRDGAAAALCAVRVILPMRICVRRWKPMECISKINACCCVCPLGGVDLRQILQEAFAHPNRRDSCTVLEIVYAQR